MKKLLLGLSALSMVATVSAQSINTADLIDVTPTAYRFCDQADLDLDELIRTDVNSPAQANLGTASFITSNVETLFTPEILAFGNLVFGGAYWKTQDVLRQGYSTYNFGGEIGNVLILNGNQSNLDLAIQEQLGLEETPDIPKMEASFEGNLQLFWLWESPQYMNQVVPPGSPVYVRLEISGYNNDMTSNNNVMNAFIRVNELGNPAGEDNVKVTFNEFAQGEDNTWSPTKWMVYEEIIPYNRIASYFRMTLSSAAANLNNGAMLIRSIEIYGLPTDYQTDMTSEKVYKSFVTHELPSSAVNSINTENAPVEFYNLQGVRVANPENGIFIRKEGNSTTKVVIR